MKIQDRTSNRAIAEAHPLLAREVARLTSGDKLRVYSISPYAAIVWNTPNTIENMADRARHATETRP